MSFNLSGPSRGALRRTAQYLLGYRICLLRERHGMTITGLAIAIGRRQPEVTEWELGGRLPTLMDLWRLSELFGVTMDALAGPPTKREEAIIVEMETKGMPDRRTSDPTRRRRIHRGD